MFFYNFLLKWVKNEENFESSIFFEAQKYYFVFESRLNFFFQMVILTTLFRSCPTLGKSTVKMPTLFRRCLTLFNSTLKTQCCFNVGQRFKFQRWRTRRSFNVDLMLYDVATSYQQRWTNVEMFSGPYAQEISDHLHFWKWTEQLISENEQLIWKCLHLPKTSHTAFL